MAEKIKLTIEIGEDGKPKVYGPFHNGPLYFWLLKLADKMFWEKRIEDAKKEASNIVIPSIVPGRFPKQ